MIDSLKKQRTSKNKHFNSLTGKLLIANPYYQFNEMFDRPVMYLTSHSEQGAVGVMINSIYDNMSYESVFKSLNIELTAQDRALPVFVGGLVEPDRGFVLHSDEYEKNVLVKFNNGIAISSNVEILKDLSHGRGPKDFLLIMGYTNWKAGRLEKEININNWLICELDNQILFAEDHLSKWDFILNKLCVNPDFYSYQKGNC